jgi:ribose/xylose/arabinose/galactoside ABC-type transport system permease subunit
MTVPSVFINYTRYKVTKVVFFIVTLGTIVTLRSVFFVSENCGKNCWRITETCIAAYPNTHLTAQQKFEVWSHLKP